MPTPTRIQSIDRTRRRLQQKLRHKVVSHIFVDRCADPRHTILVAGVARSGTTWLAEIFASRRPTRIMFEPFHSHRVKGFESFEYLQYMRPEADDPRLFAFAEQIFRGAIRDPHWIDQHAEVMFPQQRLVKDVRVCLFLRWLHERFPSVPMAFIVRHPCAVVASHLGLGWSTDDDLASLLGQRALVEDHLSEHVDWVRGLREPHEKVAALWCIENQVALRQFEGSELAVVFYEHLVHEPARVLPALYETMGLEFDPSVLAAVGHRSATVFAGSPLLTGEDPTAAWMHRLRADRAERVMEIVHRFGLGHLYDGEGQPTSPAAQTHGIAAETPR